MKMISDYDIIVERNLKELISAVNKQIKEGWQPYKRYIINRGNGTFSQMIVKYDEEEGEDKSAFENP